MKTFILIFVCSGTIALFVRSSKEPALSTSDFSASNLHNTDYKWRPASTTGEFLELIKNPEADIIRSVDDFIEKARQEGTVYAKLDKRVVRKFAKELKFKNGGLSSAQFNIIQKSLSKPDYAIFWEGFGLSIDFVQAEDHNGYACVGVGDCEVNQTHICTGNC